MEAKTLADLHQDPKNARQHNPRNVGMIVDALREVGAARSGVIDEDGRILAGNATWEALSEAGIERLKVVKADGEEWVVVQRSGLTEEQKRRLALYDNRTGELATWDIEALALDLELLDGLWEDYELEELLGDLFVDEVPEDPGPQLDRAAELQEKWQVERGQVWQVGPHRVMCGDSTSEEDVGRLMGNGVLSLALTDPPYGVSIDTSWLTTLNVKRGKPANLSDDRLGGDDGTLDVSRAFLGRWLVWGFPHLAHPKMTGWLVWDKWPGVDGGGLGNPVEMASTNLWAGFRLVRLMWGGYYKPVGENREPHPTQKPIGVVRPFVEQFADNGAIVADWFLGSGTTIVACEQTGRIGYGMDIEPKYIAVTLERLAGMGLEPRLAEIDEGE